MAFYYSKFFKISQEKAETKKPLLIGNIEIKRGYF